MTPLWDWACAHYSKDNAKEILLNLQDRFDLNVNILLWCCWRADYGFLLSEFEVRRAVEISQNWSDRVTRPLRSARRALKLESQRSNNDFLADLYKKVSNAELEAERVELEQLALIGVQSYKEQEKSEVVHLKDNDRDHCKMRGRRNLTAYFAFMGVAKAEGFSISIIQELVEVVLTQKDDNHNDRSSMVVSNA